MRRLTPEFWFHLTSRTQEPLQLIVRACDSYQVFLQGSCNCLRVMACSPQISRALQGLDLIYLACPAIQTQPICLVKKVRNDLF